MIDYFKTIVTGQFEAALCMLHECLEKCPSEPWDGPIGKYPFWQVAYHTLCFADLYLSANEDAFQLRDIHPNGWKELDEEYPSRRFEKGELLEYAVFCRHKARAALAVETPASLEAPAQFKYRHISRGELYLYSLRHVQHHTGQLSAYLRRLGGDFQDLKALRWVATGWT